MGAGPDGGVYISCAVVFHGFFEEGGDGLLPCSLLDGGGETVTGDFHEVQARVFLSEICLVGVGLDGGGGGEDGEALRVSGHFHVHAHLHHRHVAGKETLGHIKGNGIAGDEDHLHLFLQKEIFDGEGEIDDFLFRPFAVGISFRVSQKYDAFLRVSGFECFGHGEAADAGVHDADGSIVHYSLSPSESLARASIFSCGSRAMRPVFMSV